jgi:hypothetical protein
MAKRKLTISPHLIERTILFVRGQKVIVDAQLAALYGTGTKTLNKAVKRNRDRFPDDFMFQIATTRVLLTENRAVLPPTILPCHRHNRRPAVCYPG